MLKDTFYLDGIDAESVGVRLQKPVTFTGAVRNIKSVKVPGRNGDVIIDLGSYRNRVGRASCFALADYLPETIDAACAFLSPSAAYRRLETSQDPQHFWRARVSNSADLEDRMHHLNPFTVSFDCCPQRFEKEGEFPLLFSAAPASLYNRFSGIALPLIEIHGKGAGTVTVGRCVVEIKDMDKILYLDCETYHAYNEKGQDQSGNIKTDSLDFPKLHPGENSIGFTGGVTEIIITPRWWSL